MARIVISIMSANNDLAKRNCDAILGTYVDMIHRLKEDRLLRNKYKVVIYSGGFSEHTCEEIEEDVYRMRCVAKDGIYRTFEKTVEMYNDIIDRFNPDYVVRTNISTYINVKLLDLLVCDVHGVVTTSANAVLFSRDKLNTLYPRGDFYITDRETLDGVLSVAKSHLIDDTKDLSNVLISEEHVDDVLFGICMSEKFGKDYVDRISTIYYGFFPGQVSDCNKSSIHRLFLANRIKSVRPGSYSGETWGDTQYRKLDVGKFGAIDAIVEDFSYKQGEVSIGDIIVDENESKPVICQQLIETRLANIKEYIKKSS